MPMAIYLISAPFICKQLLLRSVSPSQNREHLATIKKEDHDSYCLKDTEIGYDS